MNKIVAAVVAGLITCLGLAQQSQAKVVWLVSQVGDDVVLKTDGGSLNYNSSGYLSTFSPSRISYDSNIFAAIPSGRGIVLYAGRNEVGRRSGYDPFIREGGDALVADESSGTTFGYYYARLVVPPSYFSNTITPLSTMTFKGVTIEDLFGDYLQKRGVVVLWTANGTEDTISIALDCGDNADADGDGVCDNQDAFPNDPNETTDTDGDGVGDNGDDFPNNANGTKDTNGVTWLASDDGSNLTLTMEGGSLQIADGVIAARYWDRPISGWDGSSVLVMNHAASYNETYQNAGVVSGNDPWIAGSVGLGTVIGDTSRLDRYGRDRGIGFWGARLYFGRGLSFYGYNGGRYLFPNCSMTIPGLTIATAFGNNLDNGPVVLWTANGTGDTISVALDPGYITDTDGDGVPDDEDDFPNDPNETTDTDGDGVGDNGDVFPDDPNEWVDSDGDGYGDNGDVFPDDPNEWADSDGDGYGDNGDAFPDDPNEWADFDGDGYGDNGDAFPDDPNEWADFDGDGVGDNSDLFPEDDKRADIIDHINCIIAYTSDNSVIFDNDWRARGMRQEYVRQLQIVGDLVLAAEAAQNAADAAALYSRAARIVDIFLITKTDGLQSIGARTQDDWIRTQEAQNIVYPDLLFLSEYLLEKTL